MIPLRRAAGLGAAALAVASAGCTTTQVWALDQAYSDLDDDPGRRRMTAKIDRFLRFAAPNTPSGHYVLKGATLMLETESAKARRVERLLPAALCDRPKECRRVDE